MEHDDSGGDPVPDRPRFSRGAAASDPDRRAEQGLIDAEVHAGRRELRAAFRRQPAENSRTLVADDFLRVADRPAVLTATMIAASAVAGGCLVHMVDPDHASLRFACHAAGRHPGQERLASPAARALLAAARGVPTYVLLAPDHEARRVLTALDAASRLRLVPDATAIPAGRRP